MATCAHGVRLMVEFCHWMVFSAKVEEALEERIFGLLGTLA